MRIIYKEDVENDVSILNEAWSETYSFLFVPLKSGVEKEWLERGLASLPSKFSKDHFILLTSGSTGQPKMVVASKARAEALAKVIHELQDSEPVEVTPLVLPLSYCYAFVNQWLWARVFNRELVVTKGFKNPDVVQKTLTEVKNGMLCLVGASMGLFEQFLSGMSFPGIIRLHFAGGAFPQSKSDVVRRFFPNAEIYNNYGCAEAMPRLTIRPYRESPEGSNIGRPLPGVKMKTSDIGEILFQSPYSIVAYYDNGGFHEVSPEEWLATGDLGEKMSGSDCWRIIGRSSEVFKRYGEKINLSQIHSAIQALWPGLLGIYREQDSNGEEGHVVVLSSKPSEESLKAILKTFSSNYSRAHWPLRIESVEAFPLLPNGKVDRLALAALQTKDMHWKQRI